MRIWLAVVYLMILVMVCIGGITRLTGSGLSMVEWRPLMGVLPPLDDAAWLEVFHRYQAFPQYQEVNQWMTLDDFKRIFFWEYLHRLFGRLIGVVAFVPWLVFLVRGSMSRSQAGKTLLLIGMGGLQGLLGWYMVKSGLVDRPEVSHLRLAAHLSLAFTVALFAWWLLQDLTPRRGGSWKNSGPVVLALGLLGVQIVYGAFMAGTRAGWLASTFPDMQGYWLPMAFVGPEGAAHSLLYGPLLIHWTHRFLGVLVVLAVAAVAVPALKDPVKAPAGWAVLALVVLQFVLGALTVIWGVPIAIAVAHQANALLLATALTTLLHRTVRGAVHAGR